MDPATTKELHPSVFEAACQVLNGEAASRKRGRPTSPKRWVAVMPGAKERLRAYIKDMRKDVVARQRQAGDWLGAELTRLGAPSRWSEEALDLTSGAAAHWLRTSAEQQWPDKKQKRFLDSARRGWGDEPSPRDSKVGLLLLAGILMDLGLSISMIQTRETAESFAGHLQGRPDELAKASIQLAAASFLTGARLTKERIVPCSSCRRFFVARTAKAIHCSGACRQRYRRADTSTETQQA